MLVMLSMFLTYVFSLYIFSFHSFSRRNQVCVVPVHVTLSPAKRRRWSVKSAELHACSYIVCLHLFYLKPKIEALRKVCHSSRRTSSTFSAECAAPTALLWTYQTRQGKESIMNQSHTIFSLCERDPMRRSREPYLTTGPPASLLYHAVILTWPDPPSLLPNVRPAPDIDLRRLLGGVRSWRDFYRH